MSLRMLSRTLPALVVAAAFATGAPLEARDDGRRDVRHADSQRGEALRDYGRDNRYVVRTDRRDDRDDRREQRHERRHDRRGDRHGRYAYAPPRTVYYAPPRPVVYVPAPAYYVPPPRVVHGHPGHRPPPRWSRGYRIHDYGWAPTYVVVDYDRYGLRHPPRGYHWRRDDRGDWLLVAIATGIIADVIFNH